MNIADELSRDQSKVIVCSIELPTIICVRTASSFLLKQSGSCSVFPFQLMASQDTTDIRVGEGLTPEATHFSIK